MNTNKFIVGGIVGSIVSFILGNLLYNYLFKAYFDANIYPVDFSTLKWWASLTSTLCWGFLIAYVIEQAKVTTIKSGATIAIIVSIIVQLSFDLGFYAVGMIYKDLTVIAADVLLTGFISSIIGAAIVFAGSKVKVSA